MRCTTPVPAYFAAFAQPVIVSVFCITCILQVSGPSNATVEYFNYAQNSTSSYQLLVQWDDAYRGAVTVDLQSSR